MYHKCFRISILFTLLFTPNIRQERCVANQLQVPVLEQQLTLFVLSQLLELQQRRLVRQIWLLEPWLLLREHALHHILLKLFWL